LPSEARLILKRVTNQEETPSLDNILSLTNRFDDILRVSTCLDETIRVEADVRNMETSISGSPTPTLRIHKDHPKSQIIGPVDTPIQTRHKSKMVEEQSFIATIHQKTDPTLLQFCLFSCFLSQVEPKKMDVKIAFLYGTIDEEVYVMQPLRFQDPTFPAKVYKVEKAMYRLHQAPRAWKKEDFILVQVYVDDIIFGLPNPQLCREFESLMHEKFQMSAMGELNFFLGIQVLQKEDGIFLSQDEPNIMFAVYACARHQVTPKECYLHAVKRIFRYLKGHPKLGLRYPKASPFDLVAYSDSDFGGRFQYVVVSIGMGIGTSKYWGVLRMLMIGLRLIPLVSKDDTTMMASCKTCWSFSSLRHCASPLRYALKVKPTIFVSYIRQFWSTARIETTDEGTQILATVDGIQRTVSESSLRRNLKLKDEDGIVSIPDTKLFENQTLMGYNISQNQKLIFQTGQFSHQWKYLIHTIMQCLSPKSTGFNEFSSNIATALVCLATNRTYNFSKMIFDDEPASPVRDVNKGEACPTKSGFIADQDRATIAKSSTLPHDSAPRVTFPAAGEGSMQQTISELTALCTSLQRQHSELLAKFQAQEEEILRLKEREIARVLTSMDAATILAGGIDVPTGSGSIPTAGPPATVISTGSEVDPTASPIVTSYSRRKGKEVMVESDTPKKQRLQEQIDAQYKFPLLVKIVATARRNGMPLPEVCTAIIVKEKPSVKDDSFL
nr:hypothetical protein [Tanacetum cinerariifolium]